jgi:Transmembrane family 220, helix
MNTPRWFMVSSLLMGLLFLVSLYLQYNDPDPLRWMLIYAAAAAVSFLAPWSPIAKRLALIVAVVALAWILFLSPEIAGVISFSDLFLKMNEKGGAVEVGRESGGLAVIVAWMLCCALTRRHSA